MKHLRTTPLRWLSRVPGRLCRNQIARMLVGWLVAWETVYWGTWLFLNRRQKDESVVLSMAGLVATFLVMAVVTWRLERRTRKFMIDGAEYYAAGRRSYALGVLAKIEMAHGRYLTLPGPGGEWAVKCACGQHIGNTKKGVPDFDQPLVKEWEAHVEAQVKTVMNELEGRLSELVG